MKRVIFSPLASKDIENIGDYIAKDNPSRAVSFMQELKNCCIKIGLTPEIHPLFLPPDIRRAVYGRYLIFYQQKDSSIRIERVLHSARNYFDLFL